MESYLQGTVTRLYLTGLAYARRIQAPPSSALVACFKLGSNHLNVNQQIPDVLTAYLVRHYPLLKAMNAAGPAMSRLEAFILDMSCSIADLLSWSSLWSHGLRAEFMLVPSHVRYFRVRDEALRHLRLTMV